MKICFEIFGIPRGQGRPRAFAPRFKDGTVGHAKVYEQDVDKDWKHLVMAQALAHRPPAPLKELLFMHLLFRMPLIKSLPKKVVRRIEAGELVHVGGRFDVDQLAKPIMDVLTHAGFYMDDRQVAHLDVCRVYGIRPGVLVTVGALG